MIAGRSGSGVGHSGSGPERNSNGAATKRQMSSGNDFAHRGVMQRQGSIPSLGPNHHLDGQAPSRKGDSSPC